MLKRMRWHWLNVRTCKVQAFAQIVAFSCFPATTNFNVLPRGQYTWVHFCSTYLARIHRFAKQLEVIALIKTTRNKHSLDDSCKFGTLTFPWAMLNFHQLRCSLSWKLEIVGLCESAYTAKDTSTAETTKNTAAKCCHWWMPGEKLRPTFFEMPEVFWDACCSLHLNMACGPIHHFAVSICFGIHDLRTYIMII